MVQICRASRKTTDDPIQQGIDRFYVYQDIAHYATKGIAVAEFPAPDGSVELVAEVVTMTKQDYDDILAYLVEFRNSSNGDQALLAGEVFRMLTGKSMWA